MQARLLRNTPALFLIFLSLTAFAAEWKEKVLYSFQGITDGANPIGGVAFDQKGNLYGATSTGGAANCVPLSLCGTVYKLSPPAKKGGAWTETVLHVFKGITDNNDGATLEGGVILDQGGNIYGTTAYGGTGNCRLSGRSGCGIVFQLSPPKTKNGKWTEKAIYNFRGGKDGSFPWGDLTWDKQGNLYGATQYGGGYGSCNAPYYQHCGTVFKLRPPKGKNGKWTEQVLYSFKGVPAGKQFGDGANPNGGLVFDSKGVVYGTTYSGGNRNCPGEGEIGCGTAFRLEPQRNGKWTESVIHRFDRTASDGGNPMAGMVFDTEGRLYGTTLNGGPGPGGIVFCLSSPAKSDAQWNETILHGFNGTSGGYDPESALIFDEGGSLYGTTYAGSGEDGEGSVFRLKPPKRTGDAWAIEFLHGFVQVIGGLFPTAKVIFDKNGSLYSTTTEGGTGTGCNGNGHCGTVFEVSP